ncbi:regulatory protein RecX [Treponema brennaborense]|uniref:Regulatory protein RecX n=1 Tax=Treponema brennaborense (strain DSM 12168 / CIP 105900 / DD5/3) TaxID=906968 RepID=F4LPY6_TREBD|nr:regulatory protein RecX [Treponema brennaborense]AEE16078.1 regulatory protein RecX [Treponema brennaborense DSM 12168]
MFVVSATKQISSECVQITFSTGSCFFIRFCYLKQVPPERIQPDARFSEDEAADIMNASIAFGAEKAAAAYLERSEQSRYLLIQKLLKKGFDRDSIRCALDYLEFRGYLSDSRYARAWLRNRAINHAEGRVKLLAALVSRGIERSIAQCAVDDFFESVSEEAACLRAVEKCRRQGKNESQIEKYLQRSGFSLSVIRAACQNLT